MIAAGAPTLQLLLDDGTGTFPYDITTYLRLKDGYNFTRGRQDELAEVTAGDFDLKLDNTDGRFTVGSTLIAAPSPIKMDQKIRLKVTPGQNLLSAENSSFEGGTIGSWAFNTLLGARTAGTSLANSATHPTDGTKGLLITWSTSGTGNFAGLAVTTVIGQTYTVSADIYVPTGSPNVKLSAAFLANSPVVTTKDAVVRASVTFTATAVTTTIGIDQTGSTTGQQCWIDSIQVNTGTWATPFVVGGQAAVNRFTQAVQNWPTEWPDGGDLYSIAAIAGTDLQSAAERRPLRSVIEEEILSESTLASYYLLAEAAGAASAGDSSGNQAPPLTQTGTGAAVVFGSGTGPTTDGLTAATFAGGKHLISSVISTINGVECFFATTTPPASFIAWILAFGTAGVGLGSDGKIHSDPTLVDMSSPVVTDGLVHHLVWEDGHLYLDDVDIGAPAPVAGGNGLPLRVGGGTSTNSPFTFTGTIAHVATYTAAPSAAIVLRHYQAGSTGFAGESGTARITRLAGYASLPLGTLDTSLTNVAFVDFSDSSVMAAIQDVADAEFGLAFFDGSGNLTFHNRNRVAAKLVPDVTIDANFLAPGTRFEYDMQGVVNYFQVTAAGTGVTQLVRNLTSEVTNKHGRYPNPGNGTYLVQTDQEALDRANWTVSTHAEPATRVGSLVFDVLTMTAAQQAQMLAVEADTWIRVTGLPGQTVGGTTADFIVQGVGEGLSVDDWTLSLNAANQPARYPTPWILGDTTFSVLDSTTRLYV